MSDEKPQGQSLVVSLPPPPVLRRPTDFGDGSGMRGYIRGEQGPVSMNEEISKPAPRLFTWDDAREVATFVRDGLLMIVKGIERKFDLGKK